MNSNNCTYRNRRISLLTGIIVSCYALVFMSGCTGLSHLTKNEKVLTKNTLILEDAYKIPDYKNIHSDLSAELKPTPNGKFLWMRPGPAIYHTFREPKKKKGLGYWLKYRLGTPPVLLDSAMIQNMTLMLENRMYHRGYFNAKVSADMLQKRKTAEVIYSIMPGEPFKIDTLIWPEAINTFTRSLMDLKAFSTLEKNMIYTLDALKNERIRITTDLKEKGYYYFDANYLLFLADTTAGHHRVKLKLSIKNDTPPEALRIYKINKIFVAEDYALENYHPDTLTIGDYNVLTSSHYMRPEVFLNSILFSKNDVYAQSKNNNSLRQLMGLQTYKFVNTRYAPVDSAKDLLNLTYIMTPASKMSISTELNAIAKSNNFAGPGIKLSFKSKNFMRGAELFSLNMTGRFEKQVSGEKKGDTAYEVSLEGSLDLPRHIPFGMHKKNKPYLPYSKIFVNTGIYSRVSLYNFNSYAMGLQYTWHKNAWLSHTFKPLDISVTNLVHASDEFNDFLEQNPSIRKSFEEQFIIGTSYRFTINKLQPGPHPQYYVSAGADPSGNLVNLISNLTGGNKNDKDQVTLFGNPVSQYLRFFTDLRYYFKTGKTSQLATRLYAGVGLPYGNSQVMPYVKQFYAGGTNSMRAFRARSLGPGTYRPADSLQNVLVDQTGEIKLEANLEYRFPITRFLKGAFFTDIGNIWLVHDDSLRQGGKFNASTFYKELAVGTGFGLRIDLEVAVIRFDWAFPLRKPWLPPGERWVAGDLNLFDKQWRKENLLLNISIGYPF